MLSPAVTPRQRTRPTTPQPAEKENSGRHGSANHRVRLRRSAPLSPCITNTPRSSPSPRFEQRRLRDLHKFVEHDVVSTPLSPCVRGENTPVTASKQRRLRDLRKGFEDDDYERGAGIERGSVPESPCGKKRSNTLPVLRQRRLRELENVVEDEDNECEGGREQDYVPESPRVKNRTTPLPELRHRRLTELRNEVDDDGKQHGRETEQACLLESPCVTNRSTPLPELRQRRLRELQKLVEGDTPVDVGGTEESVPEMSPKGRVHERSDEGMARKVDKNLVEENEGFTKSRKRRFEDVDTHANVAELKDTDQVKRLHKTPIVSTPGVISTTSKERPNPFDSGLPGSTSRKENPRPNPFDHPLPSTTTSAAPIRSYSRSDQTKHLSRTSDARLNDPPVRTLVSYADLWEGVSSIDSNDTTRHISNWTYDAEAPMYDFLYDGIWKRRAETSLVSVAKRKRVFWRGNCWYGGWCRIGACARRNGGYNDLDCPHLEGLIVEAE